MREIVFSDIMVYAELFPLISWELEKTSLKNRTISCVIYFWDVLEWDTRVRLWFITHMGGGHKSQQWEDFHF